MGVIDPRDFILPPFTDCPSCGKPTFGVLMTVPGGYMKRCRECWHEVRFPLPELCKSVIFLDQMVISNAYQALDPRAPKHDTVLPYWGQVASRVESLVQAQLIVCPTTEIHRDESSQVAYSRELRQVSERFSLGYRFDDADELLGRQVMKAFNAFAIGTMPEFSRDPATVIKPSDIHAWSDLLRYSVEFPEDPAWVEHLRSSREHQHAQLATIFARWQGERDRPFEEWREEEIGGWRERMRNETVGRHGRVLLAEMRRVARCRTDSDAAAKQLVAEFLDSDTVGEIPYLKITSSALAALARKAASGQKRVPGQGTLNDVRSIAIVLPYCDAIWIDNEFAALLRERPLCDSLFPATRIFSVGSRDEFLSYLDGIEASASPAHWDSVRAVYGEQ